MAILDINDIGSGDVSGTPNSGFGRFYYRTGTFHFKNESGTDIVITVGGTSHVSGGASSSSDISTTSTSFVDMTSMSVTITSNGKPTLIMFTGAYNTPAQAFFRVLEDGVAIHDGTYGDSQSFGSADAGDMSCVIYRTPTAGSHTYKVQWRTVSGTSYMYGSTYAPFRLTVVEL